jgi:energy-coupling factor transport system ATP-binding protein
MNAVRARDVTFTYDGQTGDGITGLELNVAPGEGILLCGRSGCGKTTLTRLFNGLIPRFYAGRLNGTVRLGELDLATSPLHRIALHVGSVFQNPRTQFYAVDVANEIAFGCENQGLEPAVIARRVQDAAVELGIERLLDKSIFSLSGGERQLVALASVHAMRPEVYVLDEPSASLDRQAIEMLRAALTVLRQQGRTIIVAEHRTWYLDGLVDRILYLTDGRVAPLPGGREPTFDGLRCLTQEQRLETGLRPTAVCIPSRKDLRRSSDTNLRVRDLSFTYGREQGVTLSIPELELHGGRVTALIGHNGAGKSTLVNCLCGLAKGARGLYELDGRSLGRRARINAAYLVMQEVNHQLFADSVASELTLGLREVDTGEYALVLRSLGLEGLEERHPATLSGGQKQRVAVASALLSGKRLLVFDEPTSGLDFSHMHEVARLLGQLCAPERIIIVVTHDADLVAAACDEVLCLEQGRLKDSYELDPQGLVRLREFFTPAAPSCLPLAPDRSKVHDTNRFLPAAQRESLLPQSFHPSRSG